MFLSAIGLDIAHLGELVFAQAQGSERGLIGHDATDLAFLGRLRRGRLGVLGSNGGAREEGERCGEEEGFHDGCSLEVHEHRYRSGATCIQNSRIAAVTVVPDGTGPHGLF